MSRIHRSSRLLLERGKPLGLQIDLACFRRLVISEKTKNFVGVHKTSNNPFFIITRSVHFSPKGNGQIRQIIVSKRETIKGKEGIVDD